MKISVISPVFNVEKYLAECIESVLNQTYKNTELILVDDGSADNSGLICDKYSERYPQCIKSLHIKNSGPLQARLIGIQESSGDILVFLDADDCLRNDALMRISECFKKKSCDMMLFDTGLCDNFSTLKQKHSFEIDKIFEGKTKQDLYESLIKGGVPNSLCLKSIRKECATFPKFFMDFTMRHGEDLLLSAHFITNCNKIVYLNEGLYYYRDRPGSAIHSFNMERKDSIKKVHTELEKYIDKWDVPGLRQIHNARKVRGWIDNLVLLIRNRKSMSIVEFRKQLRSMAKDPYFRTAYKDMDKKELSGLSKKLSFMLYHCSFMLI